LGLYLLLESLEGGGAEAVALRLSSLLPADKVITLSDQADFEVPEGRWASISSRLGDLLFGHLSLISYEIYSRKLSRLLSSGSVVLSFSKRTNFLNVFASRRIGHVPVVSVHNMPYGREGPGPLKRAVEAHYYRRARAVVAVSRGIASYLRALGIPEETIRVIYNPFPLDEIARMAGEEVDLPLGDGPILVTAGRLSRQKGQWHLIRAFAELKRSVPGAKLLVLGKGGLRDRLVDLSRRLGLRAHVWEEGEAKGDFDVSFLGFQRNPFKYMARADLFVLSSLWEGFSNVLVEALSLGVPAISADCAVGPREILHPSSPLEAVARDVELGDFGVLVPPMDRRYRWDAGELDEGERRLCEAMRLLLEDRSLRERYAGVGPRRASDFSAQNSRESWLSLLRGIGL